MCKRIIPPADFFHFFKILIFLVLRGGGVHLFFYKQSIFDARPENCLSFSKKIAPKNCLGIV